MANLTSISKRKLVGSVLVDSIIEEPESGSSKSEKSNNSSESSTKSKNLDDEFGQNQGKISED